ncbi:MAG: murein transglycosylase [Rhizobiales bacterium]|nr:murein transglycosylase [Hyphomicrobiales bacterium]
MGVLMTSRPPGWTGLVGMALLCFALSPFYASRAVAMSDVHVVSFHDLPGWANDNQGEALSAFQRSCQRITRLNPTAPLDKKIGADSLYGRAADWMQACNASAHVAPGADAARIFFEAYFTPVRFSPASGKGLFTGYYEPEMKGALTRHGPYQTPVLTPPPGFKSGDILPTRSQIEAGALSGKSSVLVWLADPVDAFFLHVQGSGRVALAKGGTMRLAFAGKNGQPYTSIGKVLIDQGALKREKVSMQTIRAWLNAHPDQIMSILHQNASYIFFRELHESNDTLGPLGAEGINLTPGRSLAVDRSLHPLGVPLWLNATHPAMEAGDKPLQRLMIAQDTGTAIRGLQRGDVFWGTGDEAAHIAGHMKSEGELFALLPRALAARY